MRKAVAITAIVIGLTLAWLAAATTAAFAERRVALVIGNAAYQNVHPLRTPTNDADRVAALLRTLDFEVTEAKDLDKLGMELVLRRFAADINGADVALFYFSGHGAQVGELNYLLPVSAQIDNRRSLTLDTVALQDVNSLMRAAGAKVQLLFLDACRNNPFAAQFENNPHGAQFESGRAASRGFAPIEAMSGALVVFSAAPGQTAQDGAGEVSPFTAAFLKYASLPKVDVRQMLTRVRALVSEQTDNQQVPWDSSSLLGDLFLAPKRPPPTYDQHASVEIGADGVQPLKLRRPAQPQGGDVTVQIDRTPLSGKLQLGDREIGAEDVLGPADFAALSYHRVGSGNSDAFTFRISDTWGNSEVGVVAISVVENGASRTPAEKADRPPLNISASAVSLIGFGPNLKFRGPLPAIGGDPRAIELAADPPLGQFVLGQRIVEKGSSIAAADLSRLAFSPPVGAEGKKIEAVFVPSDGSSGEARISVDLALDDCDRLAGDRLDAQGVGPGVLPGRIDVAAALPACELAVKANPNSARFRYQLARVYAALGRNSEAILAYKKGADLGHTRALWALGYRALYVPPTDSAAGIAMLEQAAAALDVYAIHTLGQAYYEGRGVSKDLEKARKLFEIAARMGHTFAMNSLGRMYRLGETVEPDPALARRYWEESAARGDIYGLDNLGFVYLDGVGAPRDPARALAYFKQASDLGHPEAPNNIGRLYVLGIGVPVDFTEARRWYAVGVERGDAWAAFNLAELTRQGKGGPSDGVRAGYYYAKAAASLNRPEPADLARKQLAAIDDKRKTMILRTIVLEIDSSADKKSDSQVVDLAQRTLAQQHVSLADSSMDSLLIGTAQAVWLSKNTREDLF
jgi:TPR repeat protein